MDADVMTTQDLVDYALEWRDALQSGDPAYDAMRDVLYRDYSTAMQIAELVEAGCITIDGITDEGHQHLLDLYNDCEN